MLSTKTDEQLVTEVLAGKTPAFQTLYYRHVDRIFGLVTRILGPGRPEREDVVQEIFFQAHRSLCNFKGDASFSTWLHRIGINVAYSHIRKQASRQEYATEHLPASASTTDQSEARTDARRKISQLYGFLGDMQPKNRIVFVLYEFEGLTLDKISSALDLPLHTVASRLRRSRAALLKALAAPGDTARMETETETES